MLIMMAGYPGSGKSTLISMLNQSLPLLIVNPKDYYFNDDWLKLSEPDRHRLSLAAWDVSKEYLIELLGTSSIDTIIVMDSAAANFYEMWPIFEAAKKFNHSTIYVMVYCQLTKCKKRAEIKISDEIYERYKHYFGFSVEKLANAADDSILIDNSNSLKNLASQAESLLQMINKTLNTRKVSIG